MLLLVAVAAAGCSRSHYRESADRETYPIIDERIVSPAYAIGRTHLEPPPASRLHDPFDPDRPPKPLDDLAAALFMDRPGGMKGSSHWGRDGHTDLIEGPNWASALGLEPGGSLKLNQDRAVEIALLNSREYQTALESVYLVALALTLNRFEFDVRWFGRNATTYTLAGSGGPPRETSTLAVNSDLGFTRSFAAGGQLVADFANAFVYEYAGGTGRWGSNLSATLTQPLLRNAGRKVRLEALTQAERDVLYAVRDFARFRKSFWAQVAVDNGGYLDLLLVLQTVRNARANVVRQEETYRLYNELFRGGRASVVELDQFFQSLQSARLNVIEAENALETALDQFKLRLGLPPRLPIELDDAVLDQFVLVAPELDRLREEVDAFQREQLKLIDELPTVESLTRSFSALRHLADRVPGAIDRTRADLARWKARLDRPLKPGEDPEQRARAQAAHDGVAVQLPEIETELMKARSAIESHRSAVAEPTRKASFDALTQDVKTVLAHLDGVIAVQTQARIYLIELPEVAVGEDAVGYARQNRLDLQNQLGAVTDAWRQVTVAANALCSDVNVVATANVGTDPDRRHPLNFASEASSYSVGLQIDGPLNRQAERNAYRASLIGYQRAKRGYVALADQIEFQVRNDLRQLERLRLSFEINRQQVLSAARQVENSRLDLLRPPDPRGRTDTTATTLSLLRAYDTLLAVRNALAANYINYEQQRIRLLLNLEALQMDERGFPTDVSRAPPPSVRPDDPAPGPEPGRLPPPAGPARPPGP